jgi:hypothetical protein
MLSEPANLVILILFGTLLGTLGTLWTILSGLYAVLRPVLWRSADLITVLGQIPLIIDETRKLQAQLQTAAVPRSAAAALAATAGLAVLLFLAIWVSPVRLEWVPLLAAFAIGEFVTLGLFETVRAMSSRQGRAMSQDFDQTVWNGYEALRMLGEQASLAALAATANNLYNHLARSARGGPLAAFIATRGEGVADKDVREAMNRFIEEAERLPLKYDQPAFQCLSDFRKARDAGNSKFLAGFALAICLGERLLKIKRT